MQVLRDHGVFPSKQNAQTLSTVGEFHVDLIPFDDDILSLEMPDSIKDCCLENDTTSLHFVSHALIRLQKLFGRIRNIKAKGQMSNLVLNMLIEMREEEKSQNSTSSSNGNHTDLVSEIDSLVLIDRSCDWISPLSTPLTYEALIDELMTIENGVVRVDASVVEGDDNKKGKDNPYLRLNNSDELFMEVRDYNISAMGSFLTKKTREVREIYDSRPTEKSSTVQSIKEFVGNIPSLKAAFESLQHHIHIVEQIQMTTNGRPFRKRWETERNIITGAGANTEYVEELICKQVDILEVLRLICLQSIVCGGFPARKFDFLRNEILHTYGFEHLLSLHNLELLGLFCKKGASYNWTRIRKDMNLIKNDVNAQSPDDIAYVTSGYAPLSCRLVEYAMDDEWKQREKEMSFVPGKVREVIQDTHNTTSTEKSSEVHEMGQKKVMLVMFIGGITYMEISALRFLSRQHPTYDLIVATTKLINGKTMLESLIENLHSTLPGDKGESPSPL